MDTGLDDNDGSIYSDSSWELRHSPMSSEFVWLPSPLEDPGQRQQQATTQGQQEQQQHSQIRSFDADPIISATGSESSSPFPECPTSAQAQLHAGPSSGISVGGGTLHPSPIPHPSPQFSPSFGSLPRLNLPDSNPFESEATTLSLPVVEAPARSAIPPTTEEAIGSLELLTDFELRYSPPTPTAPQQQLSAIQGSDTPRVWSTSQQCVFAPSLWGWEGMDDSSTMVEGRQPVDRDAHQQSGSAVARHQLLSPRAVLPSLPVSPPRSRNNPASATVSAVEHVNAEGSTRNDRPPPSFATAAAQAYPGIMQHSQQAPTLNFPSLVRSASGISSLVGEQAQSQPRSSWNTSAMLPPRMYAASDTAQPKDGYAAWHMGQARLAAGVSAAIPAAETAPGPSSSDALSSITEGLPRGEINPLSARVMPSGAASSSSLLPMMPFETMGKMDELDEKALQPSGAAAAAAVGGSSRSYRPPSPTHIGAGMALQEPEEAATPSDEKSRYTAAVGAGVEEHRAGDGAAGTATAKGAMVDVKSEVAGGRSGKGSLSKVDLDKGSTSYHPRAKACTNKPETMYESAQAALEDQVGYHQPKIKPTQPYPNLIRLTLLTSPTGKLCLSELYEAMAENFPWFKTQGMGWKNSIRHNLSINSAFLRIERAEKDDKNKGSLWFVDMQVEPASVRPPKLSTSGRGGIRAPRSKLVSAAEAELRRENEDENEEDSELDQDAEGETDSDHDGGGGSAAPGGAEALRDTAGSSSSQMAGSGEAAGMVGVKHETSHAGYLDASSSQHAMLEATSSSSTKSHDPSSEATRQKAAPPAKKTKLMPLGRMTRAQLSLFGSMPSAGSAATGADSKTRSYAGAQKRLRDDSSQGSSPRQKQGHQLTPQSPNHIVIPHATPVGPASAPASRSSTHGRQGGPPPPFVPVQSASSPSVLDFGTSRSMAFGMMGSLPTAPATMGTAAGAGSSSSSLFGAPFHQPFVSGPFTTTATLPRFWEGSRCPGCGRWRNECICNLPVFQHGPLVAQQQQQQQHQQHQQPLPSPAFPFFHAPLTHGQSTLQSMNSPMPSTPVRKNSYVHVGTRYSTNPSANANANASASTNLGHTFPPYYSSASSSYSNPFDVVAGRSIALSLGQPHRTADPPSQRPTLPTPELGPVRDGNLSLSGSLTAGHSQSGGGYGGPPSTSFWYPPSSPWVTAPQDGAGEVPDVPDNPSENVMRSRLARDFAVTSTPSLSPPLSVEALIHNPSDEHTAAQELLAMRTRSGGPDQMSAVPDGDAAPSTSPATGEDEQTEMSS
ncbi:hypothetical protein CF326_g1062 [Tilletia indica]|nr:hypothetical protein CF326_g1062 [Tilletia indica]